MLGATSMVYQGRRWNSAVGGWLRNILERRPVRLVTVALANEDGAHRLGGDDAQEEVYRPNGVSWSQRKRPLDDFPS